jgi:hypothetical protein
MLKRVEKGTGLSVSDKAPWVNLLKRAQYSRDVVDGKVRGHSFNCDCLCLKVGLL